MENPWNVKKKTPGPPVYIFGFFRASLPTVSCTIVTRESETQVESVFL